jgi:hypothetical protein
MGVGCAMAQAVSRQIITEEVPVQSRASPCVISGGHRDKATGFPRVLLMPLNDIILPMLHTNLHVTVTLMTKTSGRSLGTLTKQCFFLEYH